ncbi:hypothetical protein ACFXKC_26765 [Streptomyces sp. NPDC059340]|uniref:hypothetical protein n=1 Tax=Streptomyces sp. NPDC059340 TaxID=3346806 RepID=UPI0036C9907B
MTFGLDDGGYVVPVVGFLYGSLVLAWAASRERAAGRRAAEEVASHTGPRRQNASPLVAR